MRARAALLVTFAAVAAGCASDGATVATTTTTPSSSSVVPSTAVPATDIAATTVAPPTTPPPPTTRAGRDWSLLERLAGDGRVNVQWIDELALVYRAPGSVVAFVQPDGRVSAWPDEMRTVGSVASVGNRVVVTTGGGRDAPTGELVSYGAESQAFNGGLAQPSAYDPQRDSYRTLSNPPWISCDPCVWSAPHQGGDPQFAAWTDAGVVVSTWVGEAPLVALHDVARDEWTRLPELPIALSQPYVVEVPGRLVVFSTTSYNGAPIGVAAALDLASRRWSTEPFVDVPVVADDFSTSICATRSASAVVAAVCASGSVSRDPVALDLTTGAWSAATPRQQARLATATGPVTLEVLAAALGV